MGHLAEDALGIALGHAPDDPDDHVLVSFLRFAEGAESGKDLLLGVIAHTAGVDEDDVGRRHIFGLLIPKRAEPPLDEFAIEHVHLATHGLEIERSVRHKSLLHFIFASARGRHWSVHSSTSRRPHYSTLKTRRDQTGGVGTRLHLSFDGRAAEHGLRARMAIVARGMQVCSWTNAQSAGIAPPSSRFESGSARAGEGRRAQGDQKQTEGVRLRWYY